MIQIPLPCFAVTISYGFLPLGGSGPVDDLRQAILNNIAYLAAVGALSAALVKVVCEFLPVKACINRNFLTSWIEERLKRDLTTKSTVVTRDAEGKSQPARSNERKIYGLMAPHGWRESKVATTWYEIVQLSTSGHENALVELDSAKLCGQVNAGARVALQFPNDFPGFFQTLVSSIGKSEIIDTYRSGLSGANDKPVTDARTRVANAAQRTIDALQILLDARWSFWKHIFGFIFSALIASVTIPFILHSSWDLIRIFLAAIVGAFLAPVALAIWEALGGVGKGK